MKPVHLSIALRGREPRSACGRAFLGSRRALFGDYVSPRWPRSTDDLGAVTCGLCRSSWRLRVILQALARHAGHLR